MDAASLSSLPPHTRLRYYLYTRSRVSPDAVTAILSDILPAPTTLDDGTSLYAGERYVDAVWALSGAAKAFALQVAEMAVAVAAEAGHEGPLTADHIFEAHRRLALKGAVVGVPPSLPVPTLTPGQAAERGDAGTRRVRRRTDAGDGAGGGDSGVNNGAVG